MQRCTVILCVWEGKKDISTGMFEANYVFFFLLHHSLQFRNYIAISPLVQGKYCSYFLTFNSFSKKRQCSYSTIMIAQLSHLSTARKHLHVHSKWHEPIKQLPVYQNRCSNHNPQAKAMGLNYHSHPHEADITRQRA